MENQTHNVDRTKWPSGPWNTEPDRLDFIHAEFSCMMLRSELGHWCGYVGVPNNHPLYEKNVSGWYDDEDYPDINVHGGITYTSKCAGVICHTPEPGMPEDVWWLGFDCAHSGDLSPGMLVYNCNMAKYGEYRAQEYVTNEVKSLAEQLRKIADEVKELENLYNGE